MVFQLKNQELIQDSINNKFSPEVQLLLLVSLKNLSESNINKIQVMTSQVIDWQQLINLAKYHSVMPLVAHNLQKYCTQNLPDNIRKILKTEFRSNAIKNIHLTKELLEIVQLLKDNYINYICFKGATLASSIYDDITFRQFNDIDILVAKKDLLKAKKILLSMGGDLDLRLLGNQKKEGIIDVDDRLFIKFAKHITHTIYWKNQKREIDLHWQMFGYDFPLSLPIEYLNESLEYTIIFNQKISTLSPENNLLLLCGHGTKDCWQKLSRICDIAQLINFYPQLDWKLIIKEAKNRGALRLVLVALSLANDLYEISLPDFISLEIINDKKIKHLTHNIENSLFSESNKPKRRISQFLFIMQFVERLIDQIKSILYLLFVPTLCDGVLFPSRELPMIFYYFMRPFRLFFKMLEMIKNQ